MHELDTGAVERVAEQEAEEGAVKVAGADGKGDDMASRTSPLMTPSS